MKTAHEKKWYKKSWGIVLLLLLFFPVGTYFMWKYAHWNNKIKWGITGIFIFYTIMYLNISRILSAASRDTVETQTQPTQAVSPTPIPTNEPKAVTPPPTVSYDNNGFPDNAKQVTVANIAKTPSKYADGVTNVVFTCKILSFARNDQGDAAGLNCADSNDYSSIVQIDAGNFDVSKINADDTVTIYGFVTGVGQGKNAYGGEVTEALVSGMYINDATSGYNNAK